MTTAAVDNDVLLKGASYGLLDKLISVIPSTEYQAGVLGAARFVIKARIRNLRLSRDPADVIQSLEDFFKKASVLEPTPDETKVAASIEFVAQQYNLELDSGESQLCAIVIARNIQWLATGDKRAIRALEMLLDQEPVLNYLVGKVICLEQLIERLITKFGAAEIRKKICGEAAIDRSLGICFECMNASAAGNAGLEGLQSYIADLRKTANRVLCP
jgi:hypothetical protein